MNDNFMSTLILGTCLVFFVAWLFISSAQDKKAFRERCDRRSGHVVEKPAYKSTVRLCISGDGRVLE